MFPRKRRALVHILIAYGFACIRKDQLRKRCWCGLSRSIFFPANMFLFPSFAGREFFSQNFHAYFSISGMWHLFTYLKCWYCRRHWSLLVLCHLGENLKSETKTPCMLLLDSLVMTNPKRLEPDIRKYCLFLFFFDIRKHDQKT